MNILIIVLPYILIVVLSIIILIILRKKSHEHTQQLKAQSSAKTAAVMHSIALEAPSEMVLICSQSFELQYYNLAAASFFYLNELSINKPLKELIPTLYSTINTHGTHLAHEKRIQLDYQGMHYYELKLKPFESNDVKGIIVSLRNIDEIVRLEETMDGLKKKTEDIIKSKGMFLANMSHELRTPLNAIIGMSELLIDANLEPSQQDLIRSINQSASILYDIINTILDFSKLEANQMGLESVPMDIPKVLEEIEKVFYHEAAVKKIGLSFNIPDGMPIVMGDPVRLRQILVNIIGNAIKFTHLGSVTVTSSFKQKDHKFISVEFIIEDTGIGFPMEVKDKIFDPFVQEDDSVTRKFGGTGLGLPICRSLINIHNGNIEVNSVVGQGTKFIITLPYPLAQTNQSVEYKKNVSIKDITAKVLVAEDNLTNQKLLKMQLQNLNYDVHVVENGQQAVEEYFENDYDIIIMDCQMPIMDGFCATLIIRQQEELFNRHIPIIALTASALKEDKDKCIECGMDDYITKPLKIETLHKTLQQWLSVTNEDAKE